jgi:AGZA family xanthine/uracil permease-like MFS transporter
VSLFRLAEKGTSVRTELLAGLTTFATMAYILFVNANTLGAAGMDKSGVLIATALAAGFGSILIGVFANLPFAMAPGMGMNAYFAYTVVLQLKIPWQTALAAVFLDGVIFMVLSLLPFREKMIQDIPYNIKLAAATAIGLFITFIGMQNCRLVVGHPVVLVQMFPHLTGPILLSLFGLLLMAWLLHFRVKAAFLLGILTITGLGLLVPDGQGGTITRWPAEGILRLPDLGAWQSVAFKLDFGGAEQLGLAMIVFTFTFVSLFDTAGTFVGLATKLGWIDRERQIFPGAGRGLLAESFAIMFGALMGTSTTTTYIESASGIAAGGRTGLTAVTTGGLFFGAVLLAPLAGMIPPQATGPVLMLVGFLMLEPVLKLDLEDVTEAVPAFLTLVIVPLTFNVANGLVMGILAYVILKVTTGRLREIGPIMWILAGLCLLNLIYNHA